MKEKTVIILRPVLVQGQNRSVGEKVTLPSEDANLLIMAGQACDAKSKDAADLVKAAKARLSALGAKEKPKA